MKNGRATTKVVSFLVVILLFFVASLSALDITSNVAEYMNARMKVSHFGGSILIAQHGKVVLAKGYGMADVELGVPHSPESKFRLGSVTKQFSAIAILELQERGKLSVQDPICKYIPDCPRGWQAIKIFNLLTHTSGIPNFTEFPDYAKTMALPTTVPELLARFKDKPLEFPPGTKFSYSNSGY